MTKMYIIISYLLADLKIEQVIIIEKTQLWKRYGRASMYSECFL